ncbi:MAG: type I-U CRISPR-associated protein Csx17, partial [Pirellulales bacterium]|nr:type I-U CRISPR-associated protein Csx17 [Pirellulales bacterium]
TRPTGFGEFQKVLSEARCRVGKTPSKRPRDVAQAIARCGISRGIDGFERYAYLERNGQANLATPLGKWDVRGSVRYVELIDEVSPWLERMESAARGKNAPASWGRHCRRIDSAIMKCCQTGLATDWMALLRELGRAETALLRSGRATVGANLQPFPRPLAGLSHHWIGALTQNGSTPEIRLAISLALQAGPKRHSTQKPNADPFNDPLRRHFVPLDTDSTNRVRQPHRFAAGDDALLRVNDHVAKGGIAQDELAQLVRRRILMAREAGNAARMPLLSIGWLRVSLSDLELFINGQVDDEAIIELARPLMTIAVTATSDDLKSHRAALKVGPQDEQESAKGMPAYAAIRLCHHHSELTLKWKDPDHHGTVQGDYSIRLDPKIAALLAAGDCSAAVRLAARRLSVSGLPVRVDECFEPPETAKRWLASLAWSLSDKSLHRLADSVVHRRAVEF